MEALILAAGRGRRIRSVHQQPKGLIAISGVPLIERSLKLIRPLSPRRISIVTGYRRESYFPSLSDWGVAEVFNPDFDRAGSRESLRRGLREVTEDCLILESDLIFENNSLRGLPLNAGRSFVVTTPFVDNSDAVFAEIDSEEYVRRLCKTAPSPHEFAGISFLKFDEITKFLALPGTAGEYETEGFQTLFSEKRIRNHPARFLWREIDHEQQLAEATSLVENNPERFT